MLELESYYLGSDAAFGFGSNYGDLKAKLAGASGRSIPMDRSGSYDPPISDGTLDNAKRHRRTRQALLMCSHRSLCILNAYYLDHPTPSTNRQWWAEFRDLSTLVLYTSLAKTGAEEHGISVIRFLSGLLAGKESKRKPQVKEALKAVKAEARALLKEAVEEFQANRSKVKR